LQEVLPELEKYDASLVALTPQMPEFSVTMMEKNALNFHLLSDPRNDYAAELGLRFKLPDDLKAAYANFGLDLEKYNGDASWTLPVPARFVIDAGGVIRVVDADVDYTRRPEADKTVADVIALG
jgi:peroxiredoxin